MAAANEVPGRIGPLGTAPRTLAVQDSVKRNFDLFRASSPALAALYPDPWDAAPAVTLCTPLVYEQYANYLARVYVKGTGDQLAWGTVQEYLRKLINLAKTKFGGVAEHKPFFECVDSGTNSWFKGVLRQTLRVVAIRVMAAGESLVEQASPLYRSHIESIARALASKGTKEAAFRAVVLLTSYLAGGGAPARWRMFPLIWPASTRW